MIAVCGGAKPLPSEDAVFLSAHCVVGVNAHRPFPNRAPNWVVGNLNNHVMKLLGEQEPCAAENVVQHMREVTMPAIPKPMAGLKAVCFALTLDPDMPVWVGNMDFYREEWEGKNWKSQHDLVAHYEAFDQLRLTHKKLSYSLRFEKALNCFFAQHSAEIRKRREQ